MVLTATFTGLNGSLGYVNGQLYKLRMRELRGFVEIRRPDGTGRCIYSSLGAFLRNWNNVQH